MKIEDIERHLNNVSRNRKGNHIQADCPFCGKEKHFYLNIYKVFEKTEAGLYKKCWDCKHCLETGDLTKLLIELNLEDLSQGETINLKKQLNRKLDEIEENKDEELNCPKRRLPVGFKTIYWNKYLEDRGFTKESYKRYVVGKTDLVKRLRNYLIFPVYEDSEVKGFMARYPEEKEKLKKINEERKEKKLKQILRWQNDQMDVAKLIYGIDEIIFSTKTAIVVEGLFDKKAVDDAFNLRYNPYIKCVHTFGKSISKIQVLKLVVKKKIENIIVIQDPDAVENTKRFVAEYGKYFTKIWIGYTGDKDLGDSAQDEIRTVFENLKNSIEYNVGIVLKKKLV